MSELPPFSNSPVTVTVKFVNSSTENSNNNYSLEFTNICYKLVTHVKFCVQLPNTAALEKYWNMNPVNGTDNKQFTLPDNVRLYPGQSFADAGITVAGGGGEPEIGQDRCKDVRELIW
uniref:MSP domain-containing protein n=1 Tax=Globodera pallida TaxID=36090 RepID=A0A183C2G9_GLOPA